MQEKQFNRIARSILFTDLNSEDVNQIINALRAKRYIISAESAYTADGTKKTTAESFAHFLERFWDFDRSPYIKEKNLTGQVIHRRYASIMKRRVQLYWIPRLGQRPLNSITKDDIKYVMRQLILYPSYKNRMLSSESINQIVRAATGPLKWAYRNGLTKRDCFSSIMYCRVTHKKRIIPTMEQARLLFSTEWESPDCKLANLISMCTGMRCGEIQALQLGDIEKDRILVRHNWARMEGLKCPKNGSEREIKIPLQLYELIRRQAAQNPYGQCKENFLFWGYKRSVPQQAHYWNEALHRQLKSLHIPEWDKITFHCWRHFFAANMADFVDGRKLQFVTGHKTQAMLDHYAHHQTEAALTEIESATEKIFLPIIGGAKH